MSALAKIHVARKQLGMDEDAYRDMLDRTVGQRTAKGLSPAQCDKVVEELTRLGFQPTAKASSKVRRKALEGKYAPKLQALWIAGWNLGIVRNRDDKALLAFVKRQTGLDHTRFLHHASDAARAIEALKRWLARDGGVDWSDGSLKPAYAHRESFKVAWAQCRKINPDGNIRDFWIEVRSIAPGIDWNDCRESDWHPVMNELGRRIRSTQAAS